MSQVAPSMFPPGPKSILPGAQLYAFRRRSLSFLTEAARRYGDIVSFDIGGRRAVLVNRPEYIRDALVTRHDHFQKGRALQRAKAFLGEGLLTSEGEVWRRQRRLAQPAFHRERIKSYADVMSGYAARLAKDWARRFDGAGGELTVNISQEMMRLTLAVVGKTLFDADVEGDASEVGETVTELLDLFRFLLLPYSEWLEKLPILSPVHRLKVARAKLDAIIYRIIAEHRASGADRGDLLSMLLAAQDEETGGGMTDEQVRDEAMTIFLAGHETTANALAWTWHLLSQNPKEEAKLHREVDEVLSERRAARFEDLPNLRYTEMVLAEAMRLYPPAWIIGRLVVKDYELAGYLIPAGSILFVSQYVTHRDPRFFPEPEKFDPERFTSEAKSARPQFSYFPFGGGARRCIGESFAWTEGVVILATLARAWRLRHEPNQKIEPQPRVTLRPKGGIQMRLERRNDPA